MSEFRIKKTEKFFGEIDIPGDKSISHRAIMLGSIAEGETVVENFLNSADCVATSDCFKKLGVEIKNITPQKVVVKGKGLHGLLKPKEILDVGNSGTTIRLISGILSGQDFDTEITGDDSIKKRPMQRIIKPLSEMGAKISGEKRDGGEFAPLHISGGKLRPIRYELPVASAQVKSSVLFAGLYAGGKTSVVEKIPSRDHTERMLGYFGVPLKRFGGEISVDGGAEFFGRKVFVPGDISSAAFFIVAANLIKNSDVVLENVGLNPTRTGILDIVHRMGGCFEVLNEELLSGEPRGDIKISGGGSLKGIEISGKIIPNIIDEIPIIALMATQAEGETVIKDAKELRVKESDRIKTVVSVLRKMGATIEELEDGMLIKGKTNLVGSVIDSFGDHRIAMMASIAGLLADGETIVENVECVETSFPGFYDKLVGLAY